MKKRIKPRIVNVVEDDGRWLDPETMEYFDKDQLEDVVDTEVIDNAAREYATRKYGRALLEPIDDFKAGIDWAIERFKYLQFK